MPIGVKFEGPLICGHSGRKHKAQGLCGPCYNRRQIETIPAVRDRVRKYMRNWSLKQKFGITEERYQELLKAQGGVCKLCGDGPNGRWKQLQVDHNHKTGEVRGLLCWNCNYRIVGKIETMGLLPKLIDYLS